MPSIIVTPSRCVCVLSSSHTSMDIYIYIRSCHGWLDPPCCLDSSQNCLGTSIAALAATPLFIWKTRSGVLVAIPALLSGLPCHSKQKESATVCNLHAHPRLIDIGSTTSQQRKYSLPEAFRVALQRATCRLLWRPA